MAAQLLGFTYIENNSLTFVGNNGGTFQLSIPADIIRDLEVLDRDKLINLVVQFLQTNNLQPCTVVLLLSPTITFAQDIGQAPPQEIEVIVNKFLDTIPFENVGSKRIIIGGKTKIVGASKEYYGSIKIAFEKVGFQVSAIVPFALLQATIPELATTVEPNAIFSKFDSLRQYNIVSQEIIRPEKTQPKKSMLGKRDVILIAVFGVLMIVLFYMVLSTYVFAPPVPPKKSTNTSTTQNRPLIFPTTSQEVATPSGIIKQNPITQPQNQPIVTP